jgi:hypothetical protein
MYYFAVKMPYKLSSLVGGTMKKVEHSNNSSILRPLSLLQPATITNAIVPLQPPQEGSISDWERLLAQAHSINQMAAELEAKILELKAIVSTINSRNNYLQGNDRPRQSLCKYLQVSIPWVKQKPDQSFILTMRKVDLFRAEREAASLAQTLRQQSKRKRLAAQRHRKNKGTTDTDTSRFCTTFLVKK